MHVFKSKFLNYASAAFFTLLMFIAFCADSYRLVPMMAKYAVNLLVLGWAIVAFMIRPDRERAVFCLRFFALYFFPYLLFWLWSLGIWISEFQTFDYILRGSLTSFYMLTNILMLCAAVYLFGAKSIMYVMVGMFMTNTLIFLQVGQANGLPRLIQEYITLVFTFASNTGDAIKQMEIHGLVYGWGAFIIFFATHKARTRRQKRIQILMLLSSIFYFTTGFKRIAVPAVVVSIVAIHIWQKQSTRKLKVKVRWMSLLVIAALFGYLWLIKTGIFYDICEKYEIDLMFRDVLYKFYEDFYELTPTYLGRGVRFIYEYGSAVKEGSREALHNVYLETYIEVGFWCWIIWMYYDLNWRVRRVSDRYEMPPAAVLMGMNVYVFFTYLTDNTLYYYCINVVYRIAVMVWSLERERDEAIPNASLMEIRELTKYRAEKAESELK